MNKVIDFNSRRHVIKDNMEYYYIKFNEYKAKEFSDILTPQEKVDYDRIYKIILHS
jgi:hypothetical protein